MLRSRIIIASTIIFCMLSNQLAYAQTHTRNNLPQCSNITILAARGSEENRWEHYQKIQPHLLFNSANLAPYHSNGYEGETLARVLSYTRDHYAKQHQGADVFEQVEVLGLAPEVYAAALPVPALAQEDEELSTWQTLTRLSQLLARESVISLLKIAAYGLVQGFISALQATPDYLMEYEARRQCRPNYIVLGYSQGAVLLQLLERTLARDHHILGIMYLGNPLLDTTTHPGIVLGASTRQAPVIGHISVQTPTIPRIDYCLQGDFACDFSLSNAWRSSGQRGGIHATYFHPDYPRAVDAQAAEHLTQWIMQHHKQHQ